MPFVGTVDRLIRCRDECNEAFLSFLIAWLHSCDVSLLAEQYLLNSILAACDSGMGDRLVLQVICNIKGLSTIIIYLFIYLTSNSYIKVPNENARLKIEKLGK
jgi:hypothetical protein